MQNKSFIISTLILVLTIVATTVINSRKLPVVIHTNLEKIPMQIGKYTGREDFFPQSVYKVLNADMHVYRHYQRTDGSVISLYIGYYGTAKGGRTAHNPYGCLPGAGWGIVKDEKINLYSEHKDKLEEVNCITTRKGDDYILMLHWYQTAGTDVLGSGLEQNIQRFINRIAKNRNDGAFIRVSTQAKEGHLEQAKFQVIKFSEKVLALLYKYWPEEKEL